MNGKRYILDTNAIVSLVQGNQALAARLQTATWIGISVISQLEFLVFDGLSEGDRHYEISFCSLMTTGGRLR